MKGLPKEAALLPVAKKAKEIVDAAQKNDLLLIAPPGTGKTTGVPLFLLLSDKFKGKIIMLEPRRLAARAAAIRLASLLGEKVGETVGYRTRLDTKVSEKTLIEVVTDGVFTRLIQNDQALLEYAVVIFDEFHERSLQIDLGLVLADLSKKSLRPDLRLILMSATPDEKILEQNKNLLRLEIPGTMHPVALDYFPPTYGEPLEKTVARAVRRLLTEKEDGDVLVFLPGVPEINRALRELSNLGAAEVFPLHGSLEKSEQDQIMSPSNKRRVILATSIAESSLTVPGVRHVIDSGLCRFGTFDRATGLSGLVTRKASLSSITQRAGRLGPGCCLRLWNKIEDLTREKVDEPEIYRSDLCEAVLTLAVFGEKELLTLNWPALPSKEAILDAKTLLFELGALEANGSPSEKGKKMEALPLHPRLSSLLLRAKEEGFAESAAFLCAFLENQNSLGGKLCGNLDLLVQEEKEKPAPLLLKSFKRLCALLKIKEDEFPCTGLGRLIAWAYPDRVAKKRGEGFLLSNGRGATLENTPNLQGNDYLACATLDFRAGNAVIFLAAPLPKEDFLKDFSKDFSCEEKLSWDNSRKKALSRKILKFGALEVKSEESGAVTKAQTELLLEKILEEDLRPLELSEAAENFCQRAQAAALVWENFPKFSLEDLKAEAKLWLLPDLKGRASFADLKEINFLPALKQRLGKDLLRELEINFPEFLELPTKRKAKIIYDDPARPLLSARVQDLFGLKENPKIARGKITLAVQLLSPANRPVQTTSDMAGFWKNSYPLLLKELKGRYPKHNWPENPTVSDGRFSKPKKC